MMNRCVMLAALLLAPMQPAFAESMPQKITVPAHTAWCIRSAQPVDIAGATDSKFGDLVFALLYDRLQDDALKAGLQSTGVPYLASIAAAPIPGTGPAGATPPQAPSTAPGADAPADADPPPPGPPTTPVLRIMQVCAIVRASATTAAAGITVRDVPARMAYAIRCEARFDTDCREKILAKMTADGVDTAKLTDADWIIRQALSSAEGTDDLARDLTDSTLRPLHQAVSAATPEQLVVVAAEIP
jgi:hypothetical protein